MYNVPEVVSWQLVELQVVLGPPQSKHTENNRPVLIIFIFFPFHISTSITSFWKNKCDINQQDFKIIDLHFVKSESFSFTWELLQRET